MATTTAYISPEELTADVAELLEDLSQDGSLELATSNGAMRLAVPLAELIGRLHGSPSLDVEAWLINRPEVSELYIDGEELKSRLRPILARMERRASGPKWNDELAAVIEANPRDPGARLVFGDWLEQGGDPRGELIGIQALIAKHADGETLGKGRDAPKITALRKREATLLARFRTHLFGDLAFGDEVAEVSWWYGFFDEVTIDGSYLQTLSGCSSARFMRSLTVPSEITAASTQLLRGKASLSKTLEKITIGSRASRGTFAIGDAFRQLTHLEGLHVAAQHIELAHLELAKAKRIELHAETLTFEEGTLDLPRLERLGIDARTIVVMSGGQLDALFASPPTPLVSLRLSGLMSPKLWLDRLIEAPLLTQLRALDLADCNFDDAAVERLLAARRRLEHLESLNLAGLEKSGIKRKRPREPLQERRFRPPALLVLRGRPISRIASEA